jgi:hypothetical protein
VFSNFFFFLILPFGMIYDMICLLTAIGLPPGGICTIHIYTQTIHRMTQNKQYIEQHNLWDNVEKYCRAGQATDNKVVECMHIAFWILKATKTLSEYVILIVHWNNGCTYVPVCYIICTWPVLFSIKAVLLQHGSCILVRPCVIENHAIKVIGAMEEILCNLCTLVTEIL